MEQEKSISTRQFVLIFFVINICKKFLTVPIIMLKISGRGSVISLAVFLLADYLMLAAIYCLMLKEPEKTFFEYLEAKFKKAGMYIILTIFIAYALANLLMLFSFAQSYYTMSLFQGITWQIFIIPILTVITAFSIRSLRSIGRTAEIFSIFIIIAFIILIVLIVNNFDIRRLLPVLGESDASPMKSIRMLPAWFGDNLLMLFFMGKIKKSKKFGAVILGGGAIATVVTFILLCIVFSFYIDIIHFIDYGKKLSSVTQIGISRLSFGSLDLVLFCVVMIALLIYEGLYFSSIARSCEKMLNFKEQKNIVSIVLVVLLYLAITFFFKSENLNYYIITSIINYFIWAVNIGLPLILLIAAFIKGGKKRENTKRQLLRAGGENE